MRLVTNCYKLQIPELIDIYNINLYICQPLVFTIQDMREVSAMPHAWKPTLCNSIHL
jgi:hypothetical protein